MNDRIKTENEKEVNFFKKVLQKKFELENNLSYKNYVGFLLTHYHDEVISSKIVNFLDDCKNINKCIFKISF